MQAVHLDAPAHRCHVAPVRILEGEANSLSGELPGQFRRCCHERTDTGFDQNQSGQTADQAGIVVDFEDNTLLAALLATMTSISSGWSSNSTFP